MFVISSSAAAAEARHLERKGVRTRDAPQGAASDMLLTTPRGALAFVLTRGEAASAVVARATKAARAARRCTILLLGERAQQSAVEALQEECPIGVNVLRCENSEAAAEHVLACAAGILNGARSAANREPDPFDAAATALSEMWNVSRHDVEYLLATVSLPELARVNTEEEFADLVHHTDSVIERGLLEGAVRWLQSDAVAA